MPTRNHDDVEFGAAINVELFDDRSVAAAFVLIVRDGAFDTFVFIVECVAEPAAVWSIVFRFVICDAAFAAADGR
jgi:hypothetical protein